MRILFISGREPEYIRNNVILQGLRENGVEIIECTDSSKLMILRNFKVVLKYVLEKKDVDIIFVGFFGHPLVPIARLFSSKPILFDAYISAYDTMVHARKRVGEGSLLAKFFFNLDKLACSIADAVILDTEEHVRYFRDVIGVPEEKLNAVLVGANDKIFYPRKEVEKDTFLVQFHGTFDIMPGTEYVIRAAKLLEGHKEIVFRMIGSGPTFEKDRALAKNFGLRNVCFEGVRKYREIPNYIGEADLCLGVFGESEKLQRVISAKVFEAIAMKKPVVTARTRAIDELLSDGKSVLLCGARDPTSLADAILKLKQNPKLRKKISGEGYRIYKRKCTPKVIGRRIIEIFEEMRGA